jgi:DNA replication protein DnaC
MSSNASVQETGGIGKPNCPYCHGLGYIVADVGPDEPGFGRAKPCKCREPEQQRTRLTTLLKLSQIGTLQELTFEKFVPEGHGLPPEKRKILKYAFEIAQKFANDPSGWLILSGGYGCGKTHLAAAIANERLSKGYPVLFVNTPDLLDHLRATFNPESTVSYDERFDQVRTSPLLILDDLGTQSNSEWAQEKLYQIFNFRYNAKLPTVVTTNLEFETIEARIRSRMGDETFTKIIRINAPDFRRAGIRHESSELSSLHLHEDKKFKTFKLRKGEKGLNFEDKQNLEQAFLNAQDYAKRIAENDVKGKPVWLILNSINYGNGKTHLAAAISNYVAGSGKSVLFVVVPDLLDHLRSTFGPGSNARLDRRFEEIKNVQLLVLDDLGTESATPWAREKLYQLLNYRYVARLPTVVTTTTPLKKLQEQDPRLASRMSDSTICVIVVIDAQSYWGQ